MPVKLIIKKSPLIRQNRSEQKGYTSLCNYEKNHFLRRRLFKALNQNKRIFRSFKKDWLCKACDNNNTFKNKGKFFQYEKRIIWYQSFEVEKYRLYLFLDDALRLREETDYISRIKNAPDGNTPEKYQQKRNTFGTIAFLCDDKQDNPQEVYENYKGRLFIENMFDGMKNILEADHTYMQDEQTLQGWLFVNHICLQWYQQLYIELKDKGLLKRFSVNDYITLLKSIKKININDQWHLNEFTNATKKLLDKTGIKL